MLYVSNLKISWNYKVPISMITLHTLSCFRVWESCAPWWIAVCSLPYSSASTSTPTCRWKPQKHCMLPWNVYRFLNELKNHIWFRKWECCGHRPAILLRIAVKYEDNIANPMSLQLQKQSQAGGRTIIWKCSIIPGINTIAQSLMFHVICV